MHSIGHPGVDGVENRAVVGYMPFGMDTAQAGAVPGLANETQRRLQPIRLSPDCTNVG
ncbi:hypothetical protein XAC3218_110004 [Xanthomonas citri pv. citri]|nr:hypothetical protein XAC908_140005 [Xanthomonas citri pv. citri]CEE52491.1 hypothetical protein XAC3608_110004 [Xanthomonas citri pv. citri]CEE74260.1 hypothetical protein XAC3218_110004 [Xanthomonas citri pv. citri]CEH95483.1 hypothetical protein XACG115_140005 [Xanthomonas citri pv. citri]CEI04830.1 hypothetical protein XACB302_570004 [Xanthomonas citri pv. citri]